MVVEVRARGACRLPLRTSGPSSSRSTYSSRADVGVAAEEHDIDLFGSGSNLRESGWAGRSALRAPSPTNENRVSTSSGRLALPVGDVADRQGEDDEAGAHQDGRLVVGHFRQVSNCRRRRRSRGCGPPSGIRSRDCRGRASDARRASAVSPSVSVPWPFDPPSITPTRRLFCAPFDCESHPR